jgi:hypothetical protein
MEWKTFCLVLKNTSTIILAMTDALTLLNNLSLLQGLNLMLINKQQEVGIVTRKKCLNPFGCDSSLS